MVPSAKRSTLGKRGVWSADSILMSVMMMSDVMALVTLKRIMAQAELKCEVLATTELSLTDWRVVAV